MSHLHMPCKKARPPKSRPTSNSMSNKCDHIDCECSTHLSDSSEHVICKWDTSDQLMSQFSPMANSKLEAFSTASCIDTGGIKLTPSIGRTPNPSLPGGSGGSSSDNANAAARKDEQNKDLRKLKCELAETQAILQKTEEQLIQQMEQKQYLEEHVGQSQARSSPGYHNNPDHMGSIQDVIGHLYLNKEDAKKLLKTVKSRLMDIGTNSAPDKVLLGSQLVDLQSVLEDVIVRGQGQPAHQPSVNKEGPNPAPVSGGITVVETLMQKLNDKETEVCRWEGLVEQLHKELDQARLRSESNTNALYSKQEECRQREQDLHNSQVRAERLEQTIEALRNKENHRCHSNGGQSIPSQTNPINQQAEAVVPQSNTTQMTPANPSQSNHHDQTPGFPSDWMMPAANPPPPTDYHQMAGGALSELTVQIREQQATAGELQLEREHNQRLQELRLGVVEAGRRWENENTTLDMQIKQLTHQLVDAKNTIAHQKDEKNHQQAQLQDVNDSLKHAVMSRDDILGELSDARTEVANINQQLSAATTALTYERSANEKLKEQCSKASKSELQMNEHIRQLKEKERQVSERLTESQRVGSELRKQCSGLCKDLGQANDELQERAEEICKLQAEMEGTIATSKAEMDSEREKAKTYQAEGEQALQESEAYIEELKETIRQKDVELQKLGDTQIELELQKSTNSLQDEKIAHLDAMLKESQSALQEQMDENTAINKQRDAMKRDLEVALVKQKSYREFGSLQDDKMKVALKRWEEEKNQLNHRLKELQVALGESKQSLQHATSSIHETNIDKDRLRQRCESLQSQIHTKDVSLQTTLEKLSNAQRQFQDERRAKDECTRELKTSIASLEETKTSLSSQMTKGSSLEIIRSKLKATIQTQRASIGTLHKQLKQNQKESTQQKIQLESSLCLEKEENGKVISELRQKLSCLQNETDHTRQQNNKLTADMESLRELLDKKRTDNSDLVLSLHKAEQREGELKLAQQQLTFELQTERDAQSALRERFEEQESTMSDLRNSLVQAPLTQQQQEMTDKSPEKTFLMEHLKESLDTSFRQELNQLKAVIHQNQPSSPHKMSDHDKVLVLQRELSKLRNLRSADRVTIAMLNEDLTVLKSRLAKQKAIILSSRSQHIRKSDIQAALARAQAKALFMSSPPAAGKQQQQQQHPHQQLFTSNFDPSAVPGNHYYGFPQYAFEDCTLNGFSSDQATPGSTAFSGGSSDCDYSS